MEEGHQGRHAPNDHDNWRSTLPCEASRGFDQHASLPHFAGQHKKMAIRCRYHICCLKKKADVHIRHTDKCQTFFHNSDRLSQAAPFPALSTLGFVQVSAHHRQMTIHASRGKSFGMYVHARPEKQELKNCSGHVTQASIYGAHAKYRMFDHTARQNAASSSQSFPYRKSDLRQ